MDPITAVDVSVASPGRNFVTVQIHTREGLVGLGDATLNGRELAVATCLEEHIAPMMVGRDSEQIEDTWQLLVRGAYWRQGAIGMACVSAIDMALWDIKARRAGMPLYQLLGGASRSSLMAYPHAYGRDVPELVESVRSKVAQGYRAVRAQIAVPGQGDGYGVTSSGEAYEPASRRARPHEEVWSTQEYLRFLPEALREVRELVGPDVRLLHDVHHRLTPNEAARLAQDLEPVRLFWLEDTVALRDQSALRRVRQASTTPLAIGEVFNELHDAHTLLQERLIDYIRVTPTHAGGITGVRKILDFSAFFGVKSACHGPSDVSPVGLAAAIHLGMAVPNFGIQEFMGHDPATGAVFAPTYSLSEGDLHPGQEPGLGVAFDAEAARELPYQAAYLPVCRLRDGTVHDW